MPKTATLTVRLDPTLKHQTERLLKELGLTPSQAITIFFKQANRIQGLPFAVLASDEGEIPSDETVAAIEDLIHRREVKEYDSVEELFKSLGA